MAALNMAAINLAATDLATHSLIVTEDVALAPRPTAVALVPPTVVLTDREGLNEPSSLALALVGVATLAAYRALVHQVTGGATIKPAAQPLVKPRRRAA